MEVIVMDSKAFEELKKEFKIIVKSALKEMLESLNGTGVSDWIPEKEAQKLLHFRSKRSWQKMRDQGIIVLVKQGENTLRVKKYWPFGEKKS
ncbi:MAG: hypothetical protein IPH24_17650 [Crocinitomicaceae bacterium]|nr:hypothetical protein [Crocinitomicaceae bacterium]